MPRPPRHLTPPPLPPRGGERERRRSRPGRAGPKNPRRARRSPREGASSSAPGTWLRRQRKMMVYVLAGALVLLVAVRTTVALGPAVAESPSSEPATRVSSPSESDVDAATSGVSTSATATPSSPAIDDTGAPAPAAEPVDPRRGIFGVGDDGTPIVETSAPPPSATTSSADARAGPEPVSDASSTRAPADDGAPATAPAPSPSALTPPTTGATEATGTAAAPTSNALVTPPWTDPDSLVRAALEPDAPATVRLEIRTRPAGARVYLADRDVGTTPLDVTVAATGLTPIRIEMDDAPGVRGYAPFDGVLDLHEDVDLDVDLFPN